MKIGIYGFRGSYAFLSNFYIEPDGTHVEGEYQRAKCADFKDRDKFYWGGASAFPLVMPCPMLPPKDCKIIGGCRVKLRPDWELPGKTGLPIKVEIMQFYVAKKFRDHSSLADQLRATRGLYLEETNIWGDSYWGVFQPNSYTRTGLNMLGAILMEVRDQL